MFIECVVYKIKIIQHNIPQIKQKDLVALFCPLWQTDQSGLLLN